MDANQQKIVLLQKIVLFNKDFSYYWLIFFMQWRRFKAQTKFLFLAQAIKMVISHTQKGAQALTPPTAATVGAFLIFSEIQLIRFQAHSDL